MNAEIAKQWVTALRSGEYTQGKRRLKLQYQNEPVQHCCLGVLCELAAKARVIPPSESLGTVYITHSFGEETTGLPGEVLHWASMNDSLGYFYTDYGKESLAELNDRGSTFEDIAVVIENNVERL
jgi:hypothetical protein